MLELRATYEGTQYETLKWEWEQDIDPVTGNQRPARTRKPMVQLGVPDDVVDRIVDLAIGEGRFPAIEIEGDDQGRLRDVALGDDDLELAYHASDQLTDLCVVGSALFGFVRPQDPDGSTHWESVRIRTEWAEPVFAGGRETPRARELAEELEDIQGAGVEQVDGMATFALPKGVKSDDVVFVRHQWPVQEEVSATDRKHAKRNVLVIHRRDYTSTAIIEYEPVRVESEIGEAPEFVVADVMIHDWGVVPLVWARARGADVGSGETEGRSVFSPAVRSLTKAADYTKSFGTAAAQTSGAPTLVEIDVSDDVADAAMVADETRSGSQIKWVGAKSVFPYRSAGEHPSVFLLEPDARGIAALDKDVESLVDHAYETARVVRHDPEKLGGALSGLAVERLNEPAVAQAQGYRAILGRSWRILLNKLAVAMDIQNEPGVNAEAFSVSLRFPRIFRLTSQDVQGWITALVAAVVGRVLTRETAIKQLAALLEVEDADAEAERLLEEGGLEPFTGARPIEGDGGTEGEE
jgi:hypothetical protein